jgi:5-(carboxyamino)imidazole ribonucleotide mutase
MEKKVAVILGSASDLPVVKGAISSLKQFGISIEVHVMSAHRTPKCACEFAEKARENGFGVIIVAAGMAAHLAGVLAANTTLPVIGVPCKSTSFDGIDALLSTVQMPKGIPVATVAVDGASNAGILAAQILGVYNEEIANKLSKLKKDMADEVGLKDKNLQTEIWWKI